MLFDHFKLFSCKSGGLIEHFIRYLRLAHIMKESGGPQHLKLIVGQPHILTDYDGHGGHVHTVLKGVLVAHLQSIKVDCHRIRIHDGLHQLAGYVFTVLYKIGRIRIIVQILDAFVYTLFYLL